MKRSKAIKFIIAMVIIAVACIAGTSGYVVMAGKANISGTVREKTSLFAASEVKALSELKPDCIMVLGCGIEDQETPSGLLKDRLDAAISLYIKDVAPKLLMTGDNGSLSHNEIHVMLNYAIEKGVPKNDIFCDHAGFSTYESMYRAKTIFKVKRMVVVTQEYHMYRALYIAGKLGIKAKGAASEQRENGGDTKRRIREVLARSKDFVKCLYKPAATYGGKAIPISGNGIPSHGE